MCELPANSHGVLEKKTDSALRTTAPPADTHSEKQRRQFLKVLIKTACFKCSKQTIIHFKTVFKGAK